MRTVNVNRLRWCWDRYEGPTWVVAAVIYASWAALTLLHAHLPWWLIVPLGGTITAWHASLQHETIHAMTRVPRRVRRLLAWPPLGLGYPYALFVREHRLHHRDATLTDPRHDPESFYHDAGAWRNYHPAVRALLIANQTVLGRMTLGVPLRLGTLAIGEVRRLRNGDRSNVRAWFGHLIAVGVLSVWVLGVAKMSLWEYVGLIALPGLSLGMLRTFIEHRCASIPGHRTAIIENDLPFGMLFLYNNLHAIHHAAPAVPWYELRARWLTRRVDVLAKNGNFHYPGYWAIVGRWFVRPVFIPHYDGERTR